MKLEKLVSKVAELNKSGVKLPLAFRKTTGKFVNSRGTTGIDLVNETGHSYDWWVMLKRINGKLVLNSFNYSSCTQKHISKARSVLNKLKVSFIEVPAPQGLQDLERATTHIIDNYSKAIVAEKYARIKSNYQSKSVAKELSNLAKLGIKVKSVDLTRSVNKAEVERRSDLDHAKARRLRDKARRLEAEQKLHNSQFAAKLPEVLA